MNQSQAMLSASLQDTMFEGVRTPATYVPTSPRAASVVWIGRNKSSLVLMEEMLEESSSEWTVVLLWIIV